MTEVGLWHAMIGSQPTRLLEESVGLEAHLEHWIFEDPTLIAPSLQRVGRQIQLGNKYMDLLAIEEPGVWVVCELKKTPLYRESLAQAIDYVTRLDLLSTEQLRKLVSNGDEVHSERTQKLINKALEREARGEDRDIRVVLAGIGVREDLQHMVNYLTDRYAFPVSICTFSAVSAPGDDQGIILMRDVSEDSISDVVEGTPSILYEEKLNAVSQYFKTPFQAMVFQSFCKLFSSSPNLFVRPWKKSIMIAPQQHHGRYLAFFTAVQGGIRVSLSSEAFLEFFPDVDLSRLPNGTEDLIFSDIEKANEWASAITESLANVSAKPNKNQQQWNELDWYFAFGGETNRKWEDAIKFGFVSAGGGDWYSKTVKGLPVGARIFVYMPKIGYVGVGETIGHAVNYLDSEEWRSKDLSGNYTHQNGEPEYFVPVKWIKTLSPKDAIYGNGLFASQHSACKLRDSKTLKILTQKFDVPFVEGS
jgi:hypothetical protein